MTGKQFSLDSHLDLFHGGDLFSCATADVLPTVEDSNENEENGSTNSSSGTENRKRICYQSIGSRISIVR